MPTSLEAQGTSLGSLAKLSHGVRANSDLSEASAGLSRGPSATKKLVAAAWSNTFPAQGATLDLDFANDRGFVRGVGQGKSMNAVTFTRAASGNFVKPDGTLSSHANQGALGINLLGSPQNWDLSPWTSQLSVTVTGNAGLDPNGTNTATMLQFNQQYANRRQFISTVAGTTYTFSFYARSISGNTSLKFFHESSATGAFTNLTITDEWVRYSVSVLGSSSSGLVNFGIQYRDTSNFPTILVWGAQLEVGSSATEYFPTNINTPRFDWASTTRVANKNLLITTDTISSWVKSNVTITENTGLTLDPDGGNTAIYYNPSSTANSYVWDNRNFAVIGTQYTASVWLKGVNGGEKVSLSFNAGTVSTVTLTTAWVRYTLTLSNANSGFFVRGGPSYTGSNSDPFYFWHPQVELGSTATDYEPIAQLTTNTPLAANPTSNGLLIEEARTNRILWCRDATQTDWTKTNVTAAKDQTGVDGVANAASSLTSTSADGTCIQTITLASGSRTGSVFLKRITGTGTIQVTLDGTTYSPVELSASEWRRIVLSGTVTNPTVGIKIVTSGDAVAMDYGQVEDGAFATSPILTTTATVTRSADVAAMSVIPWYNITEGTFYGDWQFPPIIKNNVAVAVGVNLNGNNRILFAYVGTTTLHPRVKQAVGLTQFSVGNASNPANTTNYFNGSLVGSNPIIFDGPYPIFIPIGTQAGNYLNSTISRITYFPNRLSDNALQAMTTL